MSRPTLTWERVASIFTRALQAGATRKALGVVHWDIAGKCTAPQTVILTAAPSEGLHDRRTKRRSRYVALVPGLTRVTLTVELATRCRRCGWCLRRRASKWRLSALTEIDQAYGRSWFGTLTFSPDWQFRVRATASRAAASKGEDLERIEPQARFRYLANAGGALCTKWLKRVRKESKATLRYMLVVEAHKSGDPHWHVLIHEVKPGEPVRELTLRTQWSHGFSKFNLVKDSRAAAYVTKYLSKSLMARVRASVRYGKTRPLVIVATQRVDPDPKKPLYVVRQGLGTDLAGSVSSRSLQARGEGRTTGAGLSKAPRPVKAPRERQRSQAADPRQR